ncbi:ATP-binding cassette domain-containing protein [Zymomonas sp.]|uniref:ABC transporter ATP-binding protein n=1 Tax=Zymomonas sp. TaxID=2068624 RepID=UPI0025D11EBD|nr:ATP-binding cassette domain-containing protein [Zymomonas sp.]MCA1955750.1 ATP-binding cassette domain-containing protein [Zymomonas sp.]
MEKISIQLSKLRKNFGTVEVLKDVDIAIPEGQFVALVGESGCGKSTLLRLISHLERPTSGQLLIDGKERRKINPSVRYLFQEARLLPWRSVLDNVRLGAKDRDKEIARESLESVNLLDKENEWPEILSGGQCQRVSLARALAGKPKILLLDEPLGALDALTRVQMQKLIEGLWLKQKFTVLLVTHDVSEAVYLADRVIALENGQIGLDREIPLPRPRVKDRHFACFENEILNFIMKNYYI